ncbi:MAG: FAD-dependent oxidoreductase [Bacteroidales bacterium]|jgi:glycine/D-amino acid oxidase-like deaminating enzyme/NADPH-dependent 2,4-dienoyl-CoA reductase/sulfur reductase-like enzyme/Fe-S-cluster-containing hydrogenase component 2|nr:FAD-dependent oxidoreductase [Bacteroidales bacterium]
MYRIDKHPILEVPVTERHTFIFNGETIEGQKGFTIAAALHQAGFPIHSHSLRDRNRSVECGIGKCGACEMLVDGVIKRICITGVDGVREVKEVPKNYIPAEKPLYIENPCTVYKTTVAIVGAGPAGLAAREELCKQNIDNIVIDNNAHIGGQFLMQTHQFFFFEKEKKFGGMRGFDIAKTLAGDSYDGILLNSTVWDIMEGKRLAVKNVKNEEIYFIDAEYLIIAAGAIPFMPAFENDDVPGVYTAAVVQKMMNTEFTLLGKNILTVGAGNIGYLTSYQLMQAGACVKAIIEAQPREGGFPVQANRVRRLGIPILTSHTLIKAIPNKAHDGIIGAVVAECKNFEPIRGTEKAIYGIDAINICTGLIPDDQLLIKGNEIFGRFCYGAGDAIRIGEGTSAVLRGKQAAFDILKDMNFRYDYDDYLVLSKEYIESQQHPVRIIEKPARPDKERMEQKGFVIIDCLYGFACNPCAFACPYGAITKNSSSTVPVIDYDKCIGCMDCVSQCPGLAIFGYNLKKDWLFLPVEYEVAEKAEVFLVDNYANKIGEGVIEKVLYKNNKTNVARVKSLTLHGEELPNVRGFIVKENYPEPINLEPVKDEVPAKRFICHCDDVTLEEIVEKVGNRLFISIDEVKHISRLGMGACRGKRCITRLKSILRGKGITITGEATPRGPLSNQINMGELYPKKPHEKVIAPSKSAKKEPVKVGALIAGGGIAGSALFRYLSEAGYKPVLVNDDRGGSWRNIAGGRPAFSNPDLADIAAHNLELFKKLQDKSNIDFHQTRYATFAHDEKTYQALERSKEWSDAYMVDKKDFKKEISDYFNPNIDTYSHALITRNCWQATPGKTVDLLRNIGIEAGGIVVENSKILDVEKIGSQYHALVHNAEAGYTEYVTELFVNALGGSAGAFAKKLGIENGLFPVKHQAFITRRLPLLGKNGTMLDMLIDRRKYRGFTAVYGQQLVETGQIIGCASPAIDALETEKNLKINSQDFYEIVSEVFVNWIPMLSSVGFQAVWSGYYVEPRYIVDPELGLFVGMRGHGFMLSQYIAKLYVDYLQGKEVPAYFHDLKLSGSGISEDVFK